jgi:hypothetical protein
MPETALIPAKNSSHNVPATIEAAQTSLTDLARLYLVTEVVGQFRAFLDGKRCDLRV